jgi:carbonic anhydrase
MITEKNLKKFKEKSYQKYKELFKDLAQHGQKPHTLFITCCDSRVDPSLITHTKPGEIFVLRNIGNMVPPYHEKEGTYSTLAAIEYAVLNLEVSTIIVCGHSHCGACEAIWNHNGVGIHTKQWLNLASPIKEYLVNPEKLGLYLNIF